MQIRAGMRIKPLQGNQNRWGCWEDKVWWQVKWEVESEGSRSWISAVGWVCFQREWFMWETGSELFLLKVRINGYLCVAVLVKKLIVWLSSCRSDACSEHGPSFNYLKKTRAPTWFLPPPCCDSWWEFWVTGPCHSETFPEIRHQEKTWWELLGPILFLAVASLLLVSYSALLFASFFIFPSNHTLDFLKSLCLVLSMWL